MNEFPLSQPEEQIQLCINVEQVERFQGIDYLEKQINKQEFSQIKADMVKMITFRLTLMYYFYCK